MVIRNDVIRLFLFLLPFCAVVAAADADVAFDVEDEDGGSG